VQEVYRNLLSFGASLRLLFRVQRFLGLTKFGYLKVIF
jgi:hypothetical protein